MSDQDNSVKFRQIADAFIDQANETLAEANPILISSAMLYGTTRFCAFTVASQAENLDQYREELQAAKQYYVEEFDRMLSENLEEYQAAFDQPLKYEHLMKS